MAIDLPMPVPPPVTMAVLPSSENGDLVMAGTILHEQCAVHRPRSSAGFARAILGGGTEEHAARRATTVGRGAKPPSEDLLRLRDLRLPVRHLALDLLPDAHLRERRA